MTKVRLKRKKLKLYNSIMRDLRKNEVLDTLMLMMLFSRIEIIFEEYKEDVMGVFGDHIAMEVRDIDNEVVKWCKTHEILDFKRDTRYNDYKDVVLSPRIERQIIKMKSRIRTSITRDFMEHGKITKTTTNALKDIVGIRVGKMDDRSIYDLSRIMRTETTKLRTMLKIDVQEQLKKMGYNVKRTWLYTWESKEPRDNHVVMDRVLEDNRGYFTIGGVTTRGPGLSGVASEDINCMCDTEFILLD